AKDKFHIHTGDFDLRDIEDCVWLAVRKTCPGSGSPGRISPYYDRCRYDGTGKAEHCTTQKRNPESCSQNSRGRVHCSTYCHGADNHKDRNGPEQGNAKGSPDVADGHHHTGGHAFTAAAAPGTKNLAHVRREEQPQRHAKECECCDDKRNTGIKAKPGEKQERTRSKEGSTCRDDTGTVAIAEHAGDNTNHHKGKRRHCKDQPGNIYLKFFYIFKVKWHEKERAAVDQHE